MSKSIRHLLTCAGISFVIATQLRGQAATTPGYTWTTHTTIASSSAEMPPAMRRSDFTARTTMAAGRSRMDVVDGSMADTYARGDFTLADSADLLTFHVSDQTYSVFPRFAGDSARKVLEATGMTQTSKMLLARLDTVGNESLSGVATRHFRITVHYSLTVDASAMFAGLDLSVLPQDLLDKLKPVTTTQALVSDVWISTRDTLPAVPNGAMQQGIAKFSGSGFADTLRVLRAALPKGVAVRSASRIIGTTTGPVTRTDTTTTIADVSEIAKTSVHLDRLMMPEGFTRKDNPAFAALGPGPVIDEAKWRRRPL